MKAPPRRRSRRLAKNKPSPTTGSRVHGTAMLPSPRRSLRRRPSELAALICDAQKQVLFITGAGLSVDSGIRPFRSSSSSSSSHHLGLWNEVIWTTATRAAFRKDPRLWYEQFWNIYFRFDDSVQPNIGHQAMDLLLQEFPNVQQITQNIDGLQKPDANKPFIEVHGRCGLFKCCPDSDSSSDDDASDDDRPVVLGHRRKSAARQKRSHECPYQYRRSLREDQVVPPPCTNNNNNDVVPTCPHCANPAMPQALLFDEAYHAHAFYQFERAEQWIAAADVLCLVGTSCAVQLTRAALQHPARGGKYVFSLNIERIPVLAAGGGVTHILGPASETLPQLLAECRSLREQMAAEGSSE